MMKITKQAMTIATTKLLLMVLTITGLAATLMLTATTAQALNAQGTIFFVKDGELTMVLPDGRGEKTIAQGVTGQAIPSPDGTMIAYSTDTSIIVHSMSDEINRVVMRFENGGTPGVVEWITGTSRDLLLKNTRTDGATQYYTAEITEDIKTIDLGVHTNKPHFSPTSKLWAYEKKMSESGVKEVFAGNIGEEGRYVYTGSLNNVLGWEGKDDIILYTMETKILGYAVKSRERQIINLPFKSSVVVAYTYPGILYYKMNEENQSEGLVLFDPERSEETTVIESKRIFFKVANNPAHDKIVIFSPVNRNNVMGEGDLYIVDTKKGNSQKLTRDTGERIFNNLNMYSQWSPDGKNFVYEKLRLKHSNLKRGEIFITTDDGKEVKLFKQEKPYRNFALPVWSVLK